MTTLGQWAADIKTHDEWQVSGRRYLSEGSMALLDQATDTSKGRYTWAPLRWSA